MSTKKKKLLSQKLQDNENATVMSVLEPYLLAAMPPPPDPGPEPEPAPEPVTRQNCTKIGCKRKIVQEGCFSSFCFQCCFDCGKDCFVHLNMRKKREDEDR